MCLLKTALAINRHANHKKEQDIYYTSQKRSLWGLGLDDLKNSLPFGSREKGVPELLLSKTVSLDVELLNRKSVWEGAGK